MPFAFTHHDTLINAKWLEALCSCSSHCGVLTLLWASLSCLRAGGTDAGPLLQTKQNITVHSTCHHGCLRNWYSGPHQISYGSECTCKLSRACKLRTYFVVKAPHGQSKFWGMQSDLSGSGRLSRAARYSDTPSSILSIHPRSANVPWMAETASDKSFPRML